jgi:hypothetical protein
MTAACPDCTATEVDHHLQHDQTCPLGLDIDAICDADRRFFEDHPGTDVFYRPIMLSEVDGLRQAGIIPPGIPGKAVGRVRVTSVSPGIRVRSFENVLYLLDKDPA